MVCVYRCINIFETFLNRAFPITRVPIYIYVSGSGRISCNKFSTKNSKPLIKWRIKKKKKVGYSLMQRGFFFFLSFQFVRIFFFFSSLPLTRHLRTFFSDSRLEFSGGINQKVLEYKDSRETPPFEDSHLCYIFVAIQYRTRKNWLECIPTQNAFEARSRSAPSSQSAHRFESFPQFSLLASSYIL